MITAPLRPAVHPSVPNEHAENAAAESVDTPKSLPSAFEPLEGTTRAPPSSKVGRFLLNREFTKLGFNNLVRIFGYYEKEPI